MASLNGFNANNVAPSVGFDVIPNGKYVALISESEMKVTQKEDGSYLKLTFQIVEGQFKGRNIWVNLNLANPNQKAVEIAQAELSAICRAVGVMTPTDSSELHNVPLLINVACVKDKRDETQMQNKIKGYEKLGGNGASSPPAMAGATSTSPPWARKS